MENDISSDFHRSTGTAFVRDPDKVPFGVCGIAKKAARFTTGMELWEVRRNDARGAWSAERTKVGKVGTMTEPKMERSEAGRKWRMGNALLNMDGRKYGKRPKEVSEIRVNEHGSSHAADSEVRSFGNAVLSRGVGDGLFIDNAM
jgi:hypothetical protein